VYIELSLRTLRLATQRHLCPVELWCAPSTQHPFFTAVATSYPLVLQPQQGAHLGERMHRAFCATLERYDHALLMGCDCPSLNQDDLEAGLKALSQKTDVVLAPAEDGGYVMIGLNQAQPELFTDMPWGTPQVLEQTRTRIHRLNLRHHELRQQWDLDTPEDLARYRSLGQNSDK
jgi:rSAM/selenodomain-associated transferase 1